MASASVPTIVLAVVGLAAGARAQPAPPGSDGGPVIVGEKKPEWRAFELRSFDASVDFLLQSRYDRLRRPGTPDVVDRELRFRETLDLSGEAAIGHRNFIDLTGSAQFGLEDRFSDNETLGLSGHESDFVNLYDLRALLLGSGFMPTTIYSRREQNVLDRLFGGTIDDTITETGAIVQFQSPRAPTTLQYFHRVHEQDDPLVRGSTRVTQDTFTASSGIRLTDSQRLDINYTFDHIDEDQGSFFSDVLDRHDASIVHTLSFGGESRPNELRSSLRLLDQSGAFDRRDVRLDELLVLNHTDRLQTRYSVRLSEQRSGDQEQRLARAEASIRHRLFDSLTSSASLGAQRLEAPGGFRSDDLFVSGVLDYTKSVPWGRIDAAAGASYNAQHNGPRGESAGIINEPHVFNDPFPIILPRRNILPESIVVTPAVGFPVFIEGIDYTVTVFPNRAELRVPPGSAISDGETVLVSYTVGPEPASDIDTATTTLSFRYSLTEGSLRGLGAYTTFRTVDHSLDTADPSLFVLDDVRDLTLGLEYVRAGLDARVEHQRHDSTVDPFNSTRFQGIYRQPLGRGSSFSVQYAHERIEYTERDNSVNFDRLTGRWNQQIDDRLDLNVQLEYRNERNELLGDSESFDQIAGFTYRRGRTSVYSSFRNAFINSDRGDTTSQLIQFGLRRSF